MVAFVTLCDSYMGIEPQFNLWNYFCVRLQQGSGMEMVALDNLDIFRRSEKYGSLCGTMPTVLPRRTSTDYNPYVTSSSRCCEEG
jgi:hypothetical protein